jgi:hypothetical protein
VNKTHAHNRVLRAAICCIVALHLYSPFLYGQNRPVRAPFFGMHVVRSTTQEWPDAPFGALGKKSGTAWRWLEPSPGEYRWQGLDKWVDAAQRHHVLPMYTFGQPPQWASSQKGRESARQRNEREPIESPAPPNLQAWRNYVTAVVTRYRGRIRLYELWNEPNNPNHWSGSYKEMVALGREMYTIVKNIDPNAMVLTPGTGAGREGGAKPRRAATSLDQATWLNEYLRAGGNAYADAVTFHAYPRYDTCSNTLECAGSSLVAQVQIIRAIMRQNGMSGKPLYVTEGGWRTDEDLPDPEQQAAFVCRWFLILASQGVEAAYWYAWDTWGTLWNREAGLRPAGEAYQQTYSWMLGAVIGPCSKSDQGLWTCSLARSGGYHALAIWTTSGTLDYIPPKEYKQCRDLRGSIVAIKGSIRIGIAPILLETSTGK